MSPPRAPDGLTTPNISDGGVLDRWASAGGSVRYHSSLRRPGFTAQSPATGPSSGTRTVLIMRFEDWQQRDESYGPRVSRVLGVAVGAGLLLAIVLGVARFF